ncbi:hypothetical protein BH11MYX3_BH11MYX3_34820 [soil metagenome]
MKYLAAAAALALLVTDHRASEACATAPPHGAEARVADEEAVIIWDAATRTETFIRRAQFQSTARSFGFLVPTPSKPTLGEIDEAVFATLAQDIRPEVVIDTSGTKVTVESWIGSCIGGLKRSASMDGGRAPAVRVIQSAHVAGMDATTVVADDAKALTDWLGAHGFDATPELTAWLEPYIAKHWTITAFVIGTEQKDGKQFEMATKAVKMTFSADAPFYPYREPEPPKTTALEMPPRMLRVFLISDQRYTGRLGAQPWNASTLFSAKIDLPSELRSTAGNRTTVFIDDASPRIARDEVTFVPHTDQSEVKQPPTVVHKPRQIPIPYEGIAIVLVIGALVIRRRLKR